MAKSKTKGVVDLSGGQYWRRAPELADWLGSHILEPAGYKNPLTTEEAIGFTDRAIERALGYVATAWQFSAPTVTEIAYNLAVASDVVEACPVCSPKTFERQKAAAKDELPLSTLEVSFTYSGEGKATQTLLVATAKRGEEPVFRRRIVAEYAREPVFSLGNGETEVYLAPFSRSRSKNPEPLGDAHKVIVYKEGDAAPLGKR
jgi:hypothetical protein